MIDNFNSFFLSFTLNRSVVISGRYASSSIFFNWLKWTKLCDKSHRHRRRRLVTSAIRLQSTTRTHYCAFSRQRRRWRRRRSYFITQTVTLPKGLLLLVRDSINWHLSKAFSFFFFSATAPKRLFPSFKRKRTSHAITSFITLEPWKKKENHLATIWVASGLAGPGAPCIKLPWMFEQSVLMNISAALYSRRRLFVFTFVTQLGRCIGPLGMESGAIRDEDIAASSSFDGASVGPHNARYCTNN